jgi:hypothetical protein
MQEVISQNKEFTVVAWRPAQMGSSTRRRYETQCQLNGRANYHASCWGTWRTVGEQSLRDPLVTVSGAIGEDPLQHLAFRAGVEGLALVNDRLRMASGRRATGGNTVVDPAALLVCGRANRSDGRRNFASTGVGGALGAR